MEAVDRFDRFDFDASAAWRRFREDCVITTDADALLLAKAKWYKKNVDDDAFNVDLVRKRILGKATSGGSSGSSAPAPPRPSPPPPPSSQQPKAATTRTTPAAASRPSTSSPSFSFSSFSPRALLSALSSTSPGDAAALASRMATLLTGLAFLLSCASAWLSFLGFRGKAREPEYYSPRRAPASAAAWRKFALSASASHFAALSQKFGAPPVAAALRGGSLNPQAFGPLLSWLRSASQASDASLLFFLMLSSSSPAAPAAVPSLVAALFALLERSGSSPTSAGTSRFQLFPGPLRSLLDSKRRRAAQAAAASELAQGLWLVLSTLLGRGGGFLSAMGFWRTYAPMRLANSREFRAAAVGLAGGAARAARKVSGGGSSGSGSGVAAFFERLEARLASRAHSE